MEWKTTTKKLSDLNLIDNNPRTITEKEIKRLSKSIKDQGFFDPLVCDTNGDILSGNQRFRVLQAQGITEVEVTMPEKKLTEKQRKRIILLGNDHNGEFDMDVLANEFEEAIRDLELDFNLPELEPEMYEDDFEEPQEKNIHNVQKGDIWQLGEHRLMCGDSTSVDDVEKLMDGNMVDMSFTSPPYNAGTFGFQGGKDKYRGNTDNRSTHDYLQFLKDFTNIALNVSKMVFVNLQILYGNSHAVAKYLGHYSDMFKDQFVWIKNTAPPNINKGVYTNRHEMIYCFEINNKKKGFDVNWQGKYTNVIEGHTASSENVMINDHNATMPLYVPLKFINELNINDVYDPFGGSGSTLIACEQTNRKCYMMELDEHYCSVIIERWQKLTNKKAKRIYP